MKITYYEQRDRTRGYLAPEYNSISFHSYEEAAKMAELLVKTGFAVLIRLEEQIFILEWPEERVTDDYGTDCLVWLSPEEYEDLVHTRSEKFKRIINNFVDNK